MFENLKDTLKGVNFNNWSEKMAVEECSELILAISIHERKMNAQTRENLIEKICDVYAFIGALQELYEISEDDILMAIQEN